MEGLINAIGIIAGSIMFGVIGVSSFNFVWTVFDTFREVRKYYRRMNNEQEVKK